MATTVKKYQAGGVTSKKVKAPMVDPNGAWTKVQERNLPKAKDGKWIQKAVKTMRKDKPCTGSKFGSKTCPPGSKRYNLAKTFKAMGKARKSK